MWLEPLLLEAFLDAKQHLRGEGLLETRVSRFLFNENDFSVKQRSEFVLRIDL
jgi:hypothetical protein